MPARRTRYCFCASCLGAAPCDRLRFSTGLGSASTLELDVPVTRRVSTVQQFGLSPVAVNSGVFSQSRKCGDPAARSLALPTSHGRPLRLWSLWYTGAIQAIIIIIIRWYANRRFIVSASESCNKCRRCGLHGAPENSPRGRKATASLNSITSNELNWSH